MKARLKGSNEDFKEVQFVIYSDGTTDNSNNIEFEQESNTTPDHWQDVRERAAIAVLPQCLKTIQDVLLSGGSIIEDTIAEQAATNAVDCANALVEKLKSNLIKKRIVNKYFCQIKKGKKY